MTKAIALPALFLFLLLPCSGADRPGVLHHLGMCDASAAVALNDRIFAVANDEDNVIRVYDAHTNGIPQVTLDLERFLNVEREKNPETDFEGATWLGNRIYWITSHGRNREGKYRGSRHRFFATQWETNGAAVRLAPTEQPYVHLLRDLMREPRLRQFNLSAASELPPKSPGALNIEGLCATPDGTLLIGFRNPIPGKRALLLPLLNAADLIAGTGAPARFGNPILLDLRGLGIRDMTYAGNEYILVAGAHDGGGQSKLYRWAGGNTQPRLIKGLDLRGINPEAIITYPTGRANAVQLLSDDGTRMVSGVPCKTLENPNTREFRSVWVDLAPAQ